MPALSERTGVDLSGYNPIGVATPIGVTAPPIGSSSPTNTQPGLNPYLRCPIPPVWTASPDSLRQFYQNNVVPQTRLFNNPQNQVNSTGQATPVTNVTNVSNTTTNNNISVTATQSAGLISDDGTSGSRQFYQTADPETTPPASGYVYQNTSPYPLLVTVSADGGGGGFSGVIYCDDTSTPTTLIARFSRVNAGSSNPNYYPGLAFFVVPAGYYYGISVTSGGAPPSGSDALDSWTEWTLGS